MCSDIIETAGEACVEETQVPGEGVDMLMGPDVANKGA